MGRSIKYITGVSAECYEFHLLGFDVNREQILAARILYDQKVFVEENIDIGTGRVDHKVVVVETRGTWEVVAKKKK